VVVDWWRALPPGDKDLLAGVLVGREAGIGYNAWYYNGEYPEPPGGGWRPTYTGCPRYEYLVNPGAHCGRADSLTCAAAGKDNPTPGDPNVGGDAGNLTGNELYERCGNARARSVARSLYNYYCPSTLHWNCKHIRCIYF
jgi:hypothetical protein